MSRFECPECRSTNLEVTGEVKMRLAKSHVRNILENLVPDWNDDSPTQCLECERQGKASEFRVPEPQNTLTEDNPHLVPRVQLYKVCAHVGQGIECSGYQGSAGADRWTFDIVARGSTVLEAVGDYALQSQALYIQPMPRHVELLEKHWSVANPKSPKRD